MLCYLSMKEEKTFYTYLYEVYARDMEALDRACVPILDFDDWFKLLNYTSVCDYADVWACSLTNKVGV